MQNFRAENLLIEKVINDEQATSNKLYVNSQLYKEFSSNNNNINPIYVTLENSVFQLELDASTPHQSFRIGL